MDFGITDKFQHGCREERLRGVCKVSDAVFNWITCGPVRELLGAEIEYAAYGKLFLGQLPKRF
jgi:hypothetical protein